jgi:NitT/TauT family transport system permease protein
MSKRWSQTTWIIRLAWILILGILWETLAVAKVFNPLLFPTLGVILQALFSSVRSGEMLGRVGFSLLLIGDGLLLGAVLALGLAALSCINKLVNGLVETLSAIAHPLPGIALLPLVILWLGTGTPAIIFIIIHSVLWPMLVNALAGFKAVPRIYREVGENCGLSHWRSFRDILIPAAFPYLLSGLKIGWSRAWRALISAEMVFGAAGGLGGLGWYIFQRRVFMDSPGLYAGLIMIILLGMVIEEFCFDRIERSTIRKWGMSA